MKSETELRLEEMGVLEAYREGKFSDRELSDVIILDHKSKWLSEELDFDESLAENGIR